MAVTKFFLFFLSVILLNITLVRTSFGAVLPEERIDLMLHQYDGGGSDIKGPSVLVRKQFSDKISTWGSYYADSISSASIDVVTQGSAYTEDHEQYNIGADYLIDSTLLSISGAKSIQDDYDGDAFSFGISQEFFGDLTTLSMNYSQGNDIVKRNGDPSFAQDKSTQRYAMNFTQILTRSWIMSANLESIVEQGYLRNPYRNARTFEDGIGTAVIAEPENYPQTRNSDAIALKSMHYLPYRAALKFEYRYFTDNWDITGNNFQIKYTHPIKDRWIIEGKVRSYSQNEAFFYQDVFDFPDQAVERVAFRARDKELSKFNTITYGIGASYEVKKPLLQFIDKTTLNIYLDYMEFDYDNFRDARQSIGNNPTANAGEEGLYSFDAVVARLFVSMWY